MRKELRNRGITFESVVFKGKPISAEGYDRRREGNAEEPFPGSVSFIPPVAGLLIAEVIRSLIQAE